MGALDPHELRRVEQTTACRDTDAIPKVEGAGAVEERADGSRVQRMHNGVLVEAGGYYGDWMTEIIRRLHGHHEPQEELAFHHVVERLKADTPAPVMLELGAFWGYYSLWLKHALPGARTVLVEPDPANLEVGRRNFALNGFDGTFIHAAVGEDGTTGPITCESDGVERDVARVSVDGLLHREGIERLDVLLCDTQGAELAAIEGAAHALTDGRVRFALISTHHHSISGDPLMHRRCLELLRWRGAHIVAEHTARESASGDGLIVAAFDARDADFQVPVTHTRARDSLFGDADDELAAAFARIAELEADTPRRGGLLRRVRG